MLGVVINAIYSPLEELPAASRASRLTCQVRKKPFIFGIKKREEHINPSEEGDRRGPPLPARRLPFLWGGGAGAGPSRRLWGAKSRLGRGPRRREVVFSPPSPLPGRATPNTRLSHPQYLISPHRHMPPATILATATPPFRRNGPCPGYGRDTPGAGSLSLASARNRQRGGESGGVGASREGLFLRYGAGRGSSGRAGSAP